MVTPRKPEGEKLKTGRPTTYTSEVGKRIAREFANGRTLSDIMKEDWAPVDYHTVGSWENSIPEFAALMAAARPIRAEALVDSLPQALEVERDPQRARLLMDARKWQATKLSQRFADKVQIEIEGRISIADALQAGRERLRSISDLEQIDDAQVIDVAALPSPGPRDDGSASPETGDDLPDFMA